MRTHGNKCVNYRNANANVSADLRNRNNFIFWHLDFFLYMYCLARVIFKLQQVEVFK